MPYKLPIWAKKSTALSQHFQNFEGEIESAVVSWGGHVWQFCTAKEKKKHCFLEFQISSMM